MWRLLMGRLPTNQLLRRSLSHIDDDLNYLLSGEELATVAQRLRSLEEMLWMVQS